MSAEERKKILKMVEDGRISAEEAATLMKALEETTETDEDVYQTETGQGSSKNEAPELERTARSRRRRLWQIPLWIGIILTVLTAWGMYAVQQNVGHNFWFYCLTMWLMVGVAADRVGWMELHGALALRECGADAWRLASTHPFRLPASHWTGRLVPA